MNLAVKFRHFAAVATLGLVAGGCDGSLTEIENALILSKDDAKQVHAFASPEACEKITGNSIKSCTASFKLAKYIAKKMYTGISECTIKHSECAEYFFHAEPKVVGWQVSKKDMTVVAPLYASPKGADQGIRADGQTFVLAR